MRNRSKRKSNFRPVPQPLCKDGGVKMRKIRFTPLYWESHPEIKGSALHLNLLVGGYEQGSIILMRFHEYPKHSKS